MFRKKTRNRRKGGMPNRFLSMLAVTAVTAGLLAFGGPDASAMGEIGAGDTITITAESGVKLYDGAPLTASGFTYSALPAGVTHVTADVAGTQTGCGQSPNRIAGYRLYNGDIDVTASFPDVDLVDGTLTVTPREVLLTSASGSKPYDGKPLVIYQVQVSGDGFAPGEGAVYSGTGTITEPGSAENTFVYAPQDGTNFNNYVIDVAFGTLTVTERATDAEESAAPTPGGNDRNGRDGDSWGSRDRDDGAPGLTAPEVPRTVTIEDEPVPEGGPAFTIEDEPVPAGQLPATGGALAMGLRQGGLLGGLALIAGWIRGLAKRK